MCQVEPQLLTAGDLMSRNLEMVRADMPLRDAAARLAAREVHGSPVVDDAGRCVGVLSVSDLARWASDRGESKVQVPRTCAFQEKHREPGGLETILCRIAEGACPFQRLRQLPDGTHALACIEPHCVPVDWQMVEMESAPGDRVRDIMTTAIVAVEPTTPVPELARLMLDHQVSRLVVLDAERRPVGLITVNDLIQVLAHPDLITPSESQSSPDLAHD